LVNRIIVISGSSIVMDGPRDAVLQDLQQRHAKAASANTPASATAGTLLTPTLEPAV
jgi:hypothetical protein